jgi:hypothetical protein
MSKLMATALTSNSWLLVQVSSAPRVRSDTAKTAEASAKRSYEQRLEFARIQGPAAVKVEQELQKRVSENLSESQSYLNAWVGFCANGTKGERSDGIVVSATGLMGLQVESARGVNKYEFVVATGASGLRKAMGNAGMETRDARVTGEAASEIKKMMQEQAAGHGVGGTSV